ncbi:unnamed protein product [Closterium sp. NIES-53]
MRRRKRLQRAPEATPESAESGQKSPEETPGEVSSYPPQGPRAHPCRPQSSPVLHFTPPDSPSIAIPILRQAPPLLHLSSQNVLAKLQYLEELVGKKAVGSVVRSQPMILVLSIENMQGKVELLSDLIGRENTVLAVARCPLMPGSNEENLKRGFGELVREMEAALEGGEDDGFAPESPPVEEPQNGVKDARECAEKGGRGAQVRAVEGRGFTSATGATTAREMVAKLVRKCPNTICYIWERNTRHKIEYLKQDMGLSIKEVLAFPHFLGYSLDRRIRPRHVALLSKGYVLVPHEVALPKNGERGRHLEGISFGRSRADEKEAAGEDVGGKDAFGVRKHEDRSALEYAQDSYAALGGKGAVAVDALSQ